MSTQPAPARHATGPVTPAGKQRSSQNALRHGFRAANPVLPHESPEEFQALHDSYKAEFLPSTPSEFRLVFSLADAEWRLNRVLTDENYLVQSEMDSIAAEPDFHDAVGECIHAEAIRRLAENGAALNTLQRYAAQYRAQYNRSLKTLLDLRKHRQLESLRNLQRLEASLLAGPCMPAPPFPTHRFHDLPDELDEAPMPDPSDAIPDSGRDFDDAADLATEQPRIAHIAPGSRANPATPAAASPELPNELPRKRRAA